MAMDAARVTGPLLAARRFFTHAEVSADGRSLPGLPQPDYTAADVVRHLLGPDHQSQVCPAVGAAALTATLPSAGNLPEDTGGEYRGPPVRAGTKPGNDVPGRRHNGQ